MGGEPTVLGMINENLKEIKAEQKKVTECMTNMKVKQENHEQRLLHVETKGRATDGIIIEHIKNKEKHYNPYYSETFGEKVRRKKGEIAVGGGLGTAISSLILAILKFTEVI